ncbi:MAG TPA: hypothetical protein VLX91_00720 [Candidatus Acidoferrales bacterium]|nr:hypothetical protein [Candidatus Acidoferrales bacterium]
MPSTEVKTIRDPTYSQYEKIIARRAFDSRSEEVVRRASGFQPGIGRLLTEAIPRHNRGDIEGQPRMTRLAIEKQAASDRESYGFHTAFDRETDGFHTASNREMTGFGPGINRG